MRPGVCVAEDKVTNLSSRLVDGAFVCVCARVLIIFAARPRLLTGL